MCVCAFGGEPGKGCVRLSSKTGVDWAFAHIDIYIHRDESQVEVERACRGKKGTPKTSVRHATSHEIICFAGPGLLRLRSDLFVRRVTVRSLGSLFDDSWGSFLFRSKRRHQSVGRHLFPRGRRRTKSCAQASRRTRTTPRRLVKANEVNRQPNSRKRIFSNTQRSISL